MEQPKAKQNTAVGKVIQSAPKNSVSTKSAVKPTRSAKKTASPPRSPRDWRNLIAITVFYLAWTLFSIYVGQVVAAYLLKYTLGFFIKGAFFTLLYYLATYAITLALLILAPPRLLKLYRKHLESKKQLQRIKTVIWLQEDLASTPETLGVQHYPTFVDIGLAPVGYVVCIIIANTLNEIMSKLSWYNPNQEQDVGFGYFVTDVDRIFAIIAIVLIAPIAEELIMRGWLYGKLRSKWGIAVAIILTSILFGFMHGQWNVAITTFAMSIVLCGLREITGTIWSGMLLHILSNGIAFYLSYIAI